MLPAVAEGAVGTVALSETEGDWDLGNASLAFGRSGDSCTLTGTKTFVLNAGVADYLLVSGRLDGAPALAVLTRDELPEGSLSRESVIDETRRSFELSLDGALVPGERVISGASAQAALMAIRNAALLLISAESAGGIAGALEVIVDYLNTRTALAARSAAIRA